MSEIAIRCPECGQPSDDTEWCEHCGARIATGGNDEGNVWLSIGSKLALSQNGESQELVVDAVVENFSTRKVFTARASKGNGLFFVEETEDDGRDPGEIHPDVSHFFRRPLQRSRKGEHLVEIYNDVGGMTIEDVLQVHN